MNTYICVICGKQKVGYGNNPAPIKTFGRCCDVCNAKVVLPKRLYDLKKVPINVSVNKNAGN